MNMKAPLLTLALMAAFAAPAFPQQKRQADRTPPDCTVAQGPLPQTWEGQAFAIDGDTLAGVGLKPHIRIWGIQAPELRDATKAETTMGMRARSALEDLLALGENTASCKVLKWDRYCRIVAQCTVTPIGVDMPAARDAKPTGGDPIDLGEWLLGLGMAYGFWLADALPWDAAAGRRYAGLEAQARKQQRGLWPAWLKDR